MSRCILSKGVLFKIKAPYNFKFRHTVVFYKKTTNYFLTVSANHIDICIS